MHLPRCWVGIDVIGTRLHNEIMVHSAGGERVARSLRRAASKLGFDREGEQLFTSIVNEALSSGRTEDKSATEGRIECHQHWITAPDDVPVGLIVYLAPGPVPERPTYNSWVLDLESVTTRSGGDDLASLGDGRRPGEERPIRDLLTLVNFDDAPHFLSLYYDALTGKKGVLAHAYWSIRRGDQGPWKHFWSAANVDTELDERRSVYGLTVQLRERTQLDTRSRNMVRYTSATLVMVDPAKKVVVATTGALADKISDARLAEILEQIDFDRIIDAAADTMAEEIIDIDGAPFRVAAFLMPGAHQSPVLPVAILLVPHIDDNAAA
ncbi:Uncharacterised protein [Nocardia africana]|uniref:Rv3651-like N-terminal domain-containing protein n=1 Tax=Nocardia africana TaxID=134964 RepID=A0A379X4F8_9NOCA|nr:Uncharacterised protein [Nocardia africana]